jgi:hypothetical protein
MAAVYLEDRFQPSWFLVPVVLLLTGQIIFVVERTAGEVVIVMEWTSGAGSRGRVGCSCVQTSISRATWGRGIEGVERQFLGGTGGIL